EIVALTLTGAAPITNVWGNGTPLVDQGGGVWRGMIPSATKAGDQTVYLLARDANGNLATHIAPYIATLTGLQYFPLPRPVRFLDTRPGEIGCDAPGSPIQGGTSHVQTAAGRTCEGITIPSNALALTGHVTTVQSNGGYLTLHSTEVTRPVVANTNYQPNQIVNNVFTVGLGATNGAFSIFAARTTHVVVDATGYYAKAGAGTSPNFNAPQGAGGLYFHPLSTPVRLLDTRPGFPGCYENGDMPLASNSTLMQQATGLCAGQTIPANAMAVVGNATVVGPASNGYLTIYPSDAMQPLAASSNYPAGQTVNGQFITGLGPDGAFKVFTVAMTNLVVDILGYYSPDAVDINGAGLLFSPLPTPVRLLDTRAGFSGCFTPGTPLMSSVEYTQQATGLCQGVTIPAAARGVVGNATVVFPQTQGFLTFWPSNVTRPLISTSNYAAGQVWNRHFMVGLGPAGAFKMFSLSTTDLVIDLSGYFAP
ncbi:MAG: hypothetical protein ACRD82_01950, partial [Blastocatellia bacterium]